MGLPIYNWTGWGRLRSTLQAAQDASWEIPEKCKDESGNTPSHTHTPFFLWWGRTVSLEYVQVKTLHIYLKLKH